VSRSLSILVHGLSKAGKSTLASTAPKPLLYLDVEGGSRFLPFTKKMWDPMTEPPPVCDGTWDAAVVTVRDLAVVKQAYAWLNSGQHCFVSVAIDSISELQQNIIDEVSNRAQMQTQDWGTVLREFIGLTRDYHKLTEHPTHPMQAVIFVAMSKEGSDAKLHPFAQGQSAVRLPYIVDVLAAAEVVQWTDPATATIHKVHRITVGPHPRYETGERVGNRLPDYIDNPSIPLMLDYVFGPEPSAAPAPVAATAVAVAPTPAPAAEPSPAPAEDTAPPQ